MPLCLNQRYHGSPRALPGPERPPRPESVDAGPQRRRRSISGVPARLIAGIASTLIAMSIILPVSEAQELLVIRPEQQPVQGLPFGEPAGPRVGVALSGGGSRGMAHIGVLRALEETGLRPAFVAGTSSGAIIGGLYASGYTPDELEQLVATVDWRELFTDSPERADLFLAQKEERASYTLQVRFEGWKPILPTAYITGQRVAALVTELAFQGEYRADGDFDALVVPYRAVCTDLLTGERVVLSAGSLSEAMMASSAIPVLISAVSLDGRMLVDGGLVDAIPVDLVREMGADLVVASDVSAALRPADRLGNPLEVIDQVSSIMMRGPNAYSLASADLVIAPDLGDHLSSDFEGIDSLVTVGYEAARAAISIWESREEARHLVRLAGVHGDPAQALRVVGLTTDGGDEAQRARIRTLAERELLGRSVEESGLRATARRILLADGSLADLTMRVAGSTSRGGGPGTPVELHIELVSRPQLNEIRLEGVSLFDLPDVRTVLSTRTGMAVDRNSVAADVRALERFYRDRGYPLTMVPRVSFDPRPGVLTFHVDEAVIESITVEGLRHSREIVVLRELPWEIGRPFGGTSVRQTIEEVYSTGLFERVAIRALRAPGGGLALRVRVQERPRHLARLGLHYVEEQKTEGFVEYRNTNFLGLGGSLAVQGLTGSRRTQLDFETRLDRLFRTYLTYQIEAGWRQEEINTFSGDLITGGYEESGWYFSAAVGQQVRRFGQLRFGIHAEDIEATAIDAGSFPDISHRIRGLELRSIVDTLDRTPFPTQGSRHEFAWETSSDALDANVSYVRLYLSLETYATVGRHTIHPRVLYATADNTLPLVRWYRLGGMDSFYGYQRDQVRGRQILLLSSEYRFRIPWAPVAPLHLSMRYDWGGAWPDAQSFALDQMVSGFGLKASLESPLGPLEFAWGLREGGHERLYLGLGYRF